MYKMKNTKIRIKVLFLCGAYGCFNRGKMYLHSMFYKKLPLTVQTVINLRTGNIKY